MSLQQRTKNDPFWICATVVSCSWLSITLLAGRNTRPRNRRKSSNDDDPLWRSAAICERRHGIYCSAAWRLRNRCELKHKPPCAHNGQRWLLLMLPLFCVCAVSSTSRSLPSAVGINLWNGLASISFVRGNFQLIAGWLARCVARYFTSAEESETDFR